MQHALLNNYAYAMWAFLVFGPPFVKRFAHMLSVRCLWPCDAGILLPNGWMDQNETCHGGRPRPWPWTHCLRWGPSSPKGAESPNFGLMSTLAKRLPISATVEHLSIIGYDMFSVVSH